MTLPTRDPQRLARMLAGLLQGQRRAPAPARSRVERWQTPAWLRASRQGLFVVGHARTGTTILQNALNADPDVLIFGEPTVLIEEDTPYFRRHYNADNHAQGNQPNKSTWCPALLEENARFSDYFCQASRLYRRVGAKVVINPGADEAAVHRLMDGFARRYHLSHFIFTLRAPADTLVSGRELQDYTGYERPEFGVALISYLSVLLLYIDMLRTFPHVHALFHEDRPSARIASLRQALDLPLADAEAYYDETQVRRYAPEDIPAPYRDKLEEIDACYRQLRAIADDRRHRQLNQNRNHLSPGHFTDLGRIYHAIEIFLLDLHKRAETP